MQNLTYMEITDKTCNKCAGKMEEGFVADYTHGSLDSGIAQNIWIKGEFEKNWTGSVKLNIQRKLKITTFRCVNCGYLESFALEKKS